MAPHRRPVSLHSTPASADPSPSLPRSPRSSGCPARQQRSLASSTTSRGVPVTSCLQWPSHHTIGTTANSSRSFIARARARKRLRRVNWTKASTAAENETPREGVFPFAASVAGITRAYWISFLLDDKKANPHDIARDKECSPFGMLTGAR